MKRSILFIVLILPSFEAFAVHKNLGEKEISDAIALGKQWKNSAKFLEEGLRPYKFQIDSAMSWDGISKNFRLYTDWTLIAASEVIANRQTKQHWKEG